MRLVNSSLLLDIPLYEDEAVGLVVEKPEVMAEVVEDLFLQCNGQEGEFLLSKNKKTISFEKTTECIIDPFSIDFNNRKILTKIYTELISSEEDFYQEKTELNAEIVRYLDTIISKCPYCFVTMDLNLDTSKLLKMYNVRIEPEYHSLVEKLSEYAKLLSLVLGKKLLILVNIQDYLTEKETELLMRTVSFLKLYILFIDAHEHDSEFIRETWIIDHDNCIIKK